MSYRKEEHKVDYSLQSSKEKTEAECEIKDYFDTSKFGNDLNNPNVKRDKRN